jgi:hypothetical protein
MLSFGKYQTTQISTNIAFSSRAHTQNFLAYSPADDLLIFIEPKYQIYVYTAQSVRLIANFPNSDILIGSSTNSLVIPEQHDLFFIYEAPISGKSMALRVCQVRYRRVDVNFENQTCIGTVTIPQNRSHIRINGFAIKRNHFGSNRSLLFITSDVGLIYTIFDTNAGTILRQPLLMNDTSNEGSVAVSTSGTVYYAHREGHIIYELIVTRDFRVRYGKMIKSNAIKYPYGLITDECNHL